MPLNTRAVASLQGEVSERFARHSCFRDRAVRPGNRDGVHISRPAG